MKLVNVYFSAIVFLLFNAKLSNAQEWTLQQCIDTALLHNKSLQISRNTIAIGEYKVKEATANLIPRITANAEYKYFADLPYQLMPLSTFNPSAPEGQFKEAQFGVPHNLNANLQLVMPLYNAQVYGAIQSTKIATELSDLQYQKTEEQVFLEVSNKYYSAQILHHQLDFININLANAEKLLLNIQLLNEQLLAKGTDVKKIKLQVSQLTTQRENISGKYEQVLSALKFSMGIPIEQNIQVDPTIKLKDVVEYKSTSTLDMRIVKSQKRLIASEISTLNKSRVLPTLNLIGAYGTTGFGYDKQPNDFLKFYPMSFAGLQFSYPLFNGTITQRKTSQKSVELQNNDLQFELLKAQNKMQVDNATQQRIIALKSMETTTVQIELAETIYEQTILLNKQGNANLTDILLADNSLREAQQTYLSAVIEYLLADLELKKLTGNISSKNN